MRKTMFISLFVIALTTNPLVGQRLELPGELVRNFQMGNNKLPTNLVGSPYLDEAFTPGTVKIKDQTYNALLRYNAYLDEIQTKNEKNEDIALLKRDYITASFGGKDYAIIRFSENKQGYVIHLAKGDINLYKRYTKEFVAEKEATSSYSKSQPPKLIDKITYYIKKGDAPVQEIRLKKKDFINALAGEDVKSYLTENKAKLNKENEAIQLVRYLNAL